MTDYITVADVDQILGASWADEADKAAAVLQANAWMTARSVVAGDPVEDAIKTAGAYLAQEAAAGNLYADTQGDIKRTRVKADTVESETEYQDGARARSGNLSFVFDLLRPYFPVGGGSTFPVRRA